MDSLLRMVEKECCKLKKGGIIVGKRRFPEKESDDER